MKILLKTSQSQPNSTTIQAKRQRMERCANLFPGIGSEYQEFMDELHIDAMKQIFAIEKAIAERYHYETRKIIPECFKQALRHKATLVYLQMAEEMDKRLIMTSGVEFEER